MIITISGSLSQNSTNKQLLMAASRLLPLEKCLPVDIAKLPHFNPDFVGPNLRPKGVCQFDEAVTQAEGIIISTPEYASEIPGALKNALDWLVSTTALTKKPVLIFTSSGSKSGKVQAALKVVLEMVEAQVITGPDFHRSEVVGKKSGQVRGLDSFSKTVLFEIKKALQPLGEAVTHARVQAIGTNA
ncbi:MAG: NADPH-dependent FMN reductase [SAR324 cluster bacterium]|nr:NADPH-dependent FMN reductase [SAR324 cluster bacterium]